MMNRLLTQRLIRCAQLVAEPDHPDNPAPGLARARRLAKDWATPLVAATGPGARGGHSDPTGSVGAKWADGKRDPSVRWDAELSAATRRVDDAVADLTALVVTVCHHAQPVGRVSTVVKCANPTCDRASDRDRGRCRTCANYLRRHNRDRRCDARP